MAQYSSHVQVNLRLLNLAKERALHATSQALAVTLHFFPSNTQVWEKNENYKRQLNGHVSSKKGLYDIIGSIWVGLDGFPFKSFQVDFLFVGGGWRFLQMTNREIRANLMSDSVV